MSKELPKSRHRVRATRDVRSIASELRLDRPRVGDRHDVHGRPGRVVKVWPLGTIDVDTAAGRFRVTGLGFR